MTRAGKMSWNAHRLILSYTQKKKNVDYSNLSSLSPHLAISMLQIVIKHLNLSLFVHLLRGVPFLCSFLALNDIRSMCIKMTLMARGPDKYTHIHIIVVFKYSRKHN